MFSFFRRADNAGGRTGLFLTEAGVAAAQVFASVAGGKPLLKQCIYEPGEQEASLANVVKRLSSRRLPAVSVLQVASYHLLLVDAPDVPDEELRAAVRWRIKDLIDFHVDDAVIDVFEMPAQGRGGPNHMMYAVAAKAEFVGRQVQLLESAGLKLEVIDIPELCLRNVASLLEEDGRGVAMLYLANRSGILLLVHRGIMYLTRRIETGVETLAAANGMRPDLIAGLALEARRSLDYFESHYEQNPISVLYTAGLDPADHDLMTAELGISVRNIGMRGLFETALDLDDETERACLPAVGAALRSDPVTL